MAPSFPQTLRILIAFGIGSCSFMAQATPTCPAHPPVVISSDTPLAPGDPPRITADEAELLDEGVSTVRGDVRLEQNGSVLEADSLLYDRNKNDIDIDGSVRMQSDEMGVIARKGRIDLDSGEGEFKDAEFSLTNGRGRGGAKVLRNPKSGIVDLEGVSYTTCNPGDDDWLLRADRLRLDQNTRTGTSRHTSIRFKGVPIFYTPYFSFPIGDERKSGFLAPKIGSSSETGLDIAAPYYFNLAPNYDATVTPRIMSRRGLQLIGEFNYLTATSSGSVGAEYLPSDNQEGNTDRYFTRLLHSKQLSENWSTDLDYSNVSDKEYFDDLDNTIGSASRSYLTRHARLYYHEPSGWITFRGIVQDFQILNIALNALNEPYELQPKLELDIRSPVTWMLQPGISTEYVRFHREIGEEADRVDVRPHLGFNLDEDSWYIKSEAAVRYTTYKVSNRLPGLDDSLSRSVPSYTLDSGLRYERVTPAGNIQTLEPRLFYVKVPFRDQTEIPIFDSGEPDFEFSQLFAENRYSGIDRISNADQATLAITSNLIDPVKGIVRIKSGFGQIYRFEDTEVLIPGTVINDLGRSDYVAATDIDWATNLNTALGIQYDPDDSRIDRGYARAQFRPHKGSLLNLGYRFRRDLLKQADFSFLWPLSSRWRALGRYNYSLLDKQDIETLAGFEYQSCCWALRMAYRKYYSPTQLEYSNGIYLQLELTGLSRLGDNFQSLLESNVRGYEQNY